MYVSSKQVLMYCITCTCMYHTYVLYNMYMYVSSKQRAYVLYNMYMYVSSKQVLMYCITCTCMYHQNKCLCIV